MTAALGVSEAEFQRTVIEALDLFGWEWLHCRRSIGRGGRHVTATSVSGWPDLLCWRPGRVIALELKSDTGRVTPEQRRVLASLTAAGIDARVVRPADWVELVEVLR